MAFKNLGYSFESVLRNDKCITVLDGGFSTQLMRHVNEAIDGDVLWTAKFLSTNPEAVIATHLDFLRAGANCISTNTYQASIEGFVKYLHLTEAESCELIKQAVYLAQTARNQYLDELSSSSTSKPIIAGSVGPYGAFLNDGSEYTGNYDQSISVKTMKDWHRPRIAALIEAGVDVLALETIPCKNEAEVLVELIKEFPSIKAWLTFSVGADGVSLANGENFQKAVKKCYNLNPKQILAIGVNCLAPALVESFISKINDGRKFNRIPIIIYPNSGEVYIDKSWLGSEKCEPIEKYVHKWLDLGVTYIGGCCRTTAGDITKIKAEIVKWENNKNQMSTSDESDNDK